ncbi:MAG TPA: uracil-DNA glycosylase [Bacteroidales bacterium]|nr:uracil-DNA glycosylase [Bacteroidales bacterium]
MMMEQLEQEVLSCTKCDLHRTRHNVIFGEGNISARILIIGEAPGHDEDMIGRPFVGKSGQMLDKILAACGFTRQQHVYISNIVKCRPPGNRIPTDDETKTCVPYLFKQIEIIDPLILIPLGASALRVFFGKEYRITKVRGNWLNWYNKMVMPVYHPAALLRNPNLKRDTWEDYKKIVRKYRELVDPQHYSEYV